LPEIVALDLESNGCTAETNGLVIFVDTLKEAVLPVYAAEKTSLLSVYSEDEMKDALQELNLVARAEVEKTVVNNGNEWEVTFSGFSPATGNLIPKVLVNDVMTSAFINGRASAYARNEYMLTGLTEGTSYFFNVAPVNSYGSGVSICTTPTSKQPSYQTPTPVLNLRTAVFDQKVLNVQFNTPASDGGKQISKYKVQIDPTPTFNSGTTGKSKVEFIKLSSDTSKVSDVQLVTVVTGPGFMPYGTFVLTFLDQNTSELDFNITAAEMKLELESLSTVNEVSVERTLFCSNQAWRDRFR
jgi:hypothetical protein